MVRCTFLFQVSIYYKYSGALHHFSLVSCLLATNRLEPLAAVYRPVAARISTLF
jgi:hypothetical protein